MSQMRLPSGSRTKGGCRMLSGLRRSNYLSFVDLEAIVVAAAFTMYDHLFVCQCDRGKAPLATCCPGLRALVLRARLCRVGQLQGRVEGDGAGNGIADGRAVVALDIAEVPGLALVVPVVGLELVRLLEVL